MIKKWKQFLNENLSKYQLNNILDKISNFGKESLSNHEQKLLNSYSDKSIDVEKEIEKHINKFKTSKNIIGQIGLEVSDSNLEQNIGRYVKIKRDKDWRKLGLLVNMGMVFEIVAIQKHYGYVDGKYIRDKIGYRIAEVGRDNDFGRVGDVDEIEFLNISEEEAIEINEKIHTNFNKGIFPNWYYK